MTKKKKTSKLCKQKPNPAEHYLKGVENIYPHGRMEKQGCIVM